MKKVVKVALAILAAALLLGTASCSNGSDSPNPLVPPVTPTTPATDNTQSGGSGGAGGGSVGGTATSGVNVSAKSFNGTAITDSSVFIASRNLSLPAIFACDHEVTQGEYETYCKYGGSSPSSSYGAGTNYPAYYVNWYDAIVYCNLKSKADGLIPCYKLGTSTDTYDATDVTKWTGIIAGTGTDAGKYCGPVSETDAWNGITCDFTATGWRLPTEAEWEMLARGGNLTNSNQTTYSGSNTIGDVAWYMSNSDSKTHEVKTKKVENKDSANSLSLYDMSGNVYEWCWDFYNTIDSNTAWTGPSGASSGSDRVFRGGCWNDGAVFCSVARRGNDSPNLRHYFLGFRVVRTATSGGSQQQQVPAGCVSVPAKNFDGTVDGAAISASYVFIANRKLTLPAIYACDHEVTQGEYETYCQYGGLSPSTTYGAGTNYPAYYVSWYDAIVYCNLKSKADGLTPCYKMGTSTDAADVTKWTGVVKHGEGAAAKYCGPVSDAAWDGITCDFTANGWRLPTEAEWEMLARGGNLTNSNQTTYSGSNTVGDVAWYYENSGDNGTSTNGKTHQVKTKTANSIGLYDMRGNVWEWCWDFYNTIYSSTVWTGPAVTPSGSCRVFRGGGWDCDAGGCSVAIRDGNSPGLRSYHLGFRVVRTAQ